MNVCVFLAVATQHAMRMYRTVICSLSSSETFFPHYLMSGKIFFGGKKVTELKMHILIFSSILSAIFLILRRTE